MNKSTISYYMFLSWRYIRKNLSRSVHSILGIMLTVILAFGALTIGHEILDYNLAELYDVYGVFQLSGSYSEAPLSLVSRLEQHELVDNVYAQIYGDSMVNEEEGESVSDRYDEYTHYEVYIALKDTSDLAGSAAKLREDLGTDKILPDPQVESYLGQGDSLYAAAKRVIVTLAVSVFVVFTMFIIRNTMMLAVLERRGDYGQMRCVGMSAKQLYLLLFIEGIILSLVGVVAGISIAFCGLKAMEGWLDNYLQLGGLLKFTCYPSDVVLTAVLTVAVILFALLEPARQAAMTTPAEAMWGGAPRLYSEKHMFKIKRRHPVIAFLFGVEGEYARKNISRSRVRMLYLFLGILVCVMMVCGVSCFVDCGYATIQREFRGKNKEFPEIIYVEGPYSEKEYNRLTKEISAMDGVEKTGIFFSKAGFSTDITDPGLISREVWQVTQNAYDRRQIDALSKYLVDGKISYENMMKENGVILCDFTYNIRDGESGYNYVDRRTTDYKVGDTITEVQFSAQKKCDQTFRELEEEYGLTDAYFERNRYRGDTEEVEEIKQEMGEKEFKKAKKEAEKKYDTCFNEFMQKIHDAGYTAEETAKGEKITKDSFPHYVYDAMMYDCYKRGETITYTIQAIISEDVYDANAGALDGVSWQYVHLVRPMDSILSDVYTSSDITVKSWNWGVGILRDVRRLSGDLRNFVRNVEPTVYTTEESAVYSDAEEEDAAGSNVNHSKYTLFGMEEFDRIVGMKRDLHLVEAVGYGIAIFIGLICMIQIFNTVCANLSLRNKELELYQTVGMSKLQKYKMILLEHSFIAVSAIVAAYCLTWISSWFIVDKILNQDGSFIYDWNRYKLLFLCIMIFVMTLLAGIGGLHQGRRHSGK